MPVLTTPRRITLYWLLLLVPTLAVGMGALVLVRREQARLDEQSKASFLAQRTAVEARARVIAENVELFMGEIESELMTTLREAPPTEPQAFLAEWERSNPLVRTAFYLRRQGELAWPVAPKAAELQAWFNGLLAAGAPWRTGLRQQVAPTEFDDSRRGDVSANVAQFNNARTAIKDVAGRGQLLKNAGEVAAPETSGWMRWRGEGGLHVIGWRHPAAGDVIGVEIDLRAIAARLGELLPREGEFVNAFAVRDATGATLQSKVYPADAVPPTTTTETITVPLSGVVLPGWEVVGWVRDSRTTRISGAGFFLAGSLLVGSFVAAILAGGSLLLWQARRSEAEAAQKTSFVANVSHEFKTPLTTIRLYAELLEQGRVRDAAEGADYLRTIGRETQRLARLVNNALDFSRLEQGRKKYARERFDVSAELARLLATHAPRLAEGGLTLKPGLPAASIEITTDRDALEQIVLNLLDNALKYAADGAEVSVALAAKTAGGVQVRVADRGPGVPADQRERIFEKFHRVDDALTAEKGGAGLGLSIARQLARGLGGELHCAAREGGGAEFILELP